MEIKVNEWYQFKTGSVAQCKYIFDDNRVKCKFLFQFLDGSFDFFLGDDLEHLPRFNMPKDWEVTENGKCKHGDRYLLTDGSYEEVCSNVGKTVQDAIDSYNNVSPIKKAVKIIRKSKKYKQYEWEDRHALRGEWVCLPKKEFQINEFILTPDGRFLINGYDSSYLLENAKFLDDSTFGRLLE